MQIEGRSLAIGFGVAMAFNMCSSSEVRHTASVVVFASRDAAIRVLSSIGSQPKQEKEKKASRVDSAPSASVPAAPAPSAGK